jgi:hypothetical protein
VRSVIRGQREPLIHRGAATGDAVIVWTKPEHEAAPSIPARRSMTPRADARTRDLRVLGRIGRRRVTADECGAGAGLDQSWNRVHHPNELAESPNQELVPNVLSFAAARSTLFHAR